MADTQRVVVITGGSRGIGRAIALKFAMEKCKLVLVHYDPDESAVRATIEEAERAGAEAEGHKTNLSVFSDVQALFSGILETHGRVDVLVNNAGITRDTLLMRMSEENWDAVLAVNLKSVFQCTRAVLQTMMKQRQGRIVSISSVVGRTGNAGQSNYAASKAGILGFTRSVAQEAAPRGITVNAVAPGFIDTEMTAGLSQKVKDRFLQQVPLGRIGRPEDVSEAVHWLCSEAAGYITGQTIHVNGGLFM